jgi:hypothetical protein
LCAQRQSHGGTLVQRAPEGRVQSAAPHRAGEALFLEYARQLDGNDPAHLPCVRGAEACRGMAEAGEGTDLAA